MLSKLKFNPRFVSSTESKWFWVYATKVCGLLYDPEIEYWATGRNGAAKPTMD